jgi:hypothetical protein
MADLKENAIEWYTGDNEITCTFTQRKFINKIRKMMDKQPKSVTKFIENPDGSICCHIPLKALKLYLKTPNEKGVVECEFTEEDI